MNGLASSTSAQIKEIDAADKGKSIKRLYDSVEQLPTFTDDRSPSSGPEGQSREAIQRRKRGDGAAVPLPRRHELQFNPEPLKIVDACQSTLLGKVAEEVELDVADQFRKRWTLADDG